MAIRKPDHDRKREINLDGPEGNAFMLLGTARKWADQLGLDANAITREMMAGNYLHLVKTFDKYFGEFVDLIWSGFPKVSALETRDDE